MTDLGAMRNAADNTYLLWYNMLPDIPVEYWFVPGELRLVHVIDPLPGHCGMGTGKPGGTVKDFKDKTRKS